MKVENTTTRQEALHELRGVKRREKGARALCVTFFVLAVLGAILFAFGIKGNCALFAPSILLLLGGGFGCKLSQGYITSLVLNSRKIERDIQHLPQEQAL